jgi:hypothetical protein
MLKADRLFRKNKRGDLSVAWSKALKRAWRWYWKAKAKALNLSPNLTHGQEVHMVTIDGLLLEYNIERDPFGYFLEILYGTGERDYQAFRVARRGDVIPTLLYGISHHYSLPSDKVVEIEAGFFPNRA